MGDMDLENFIKKEEFVEILIAQLELPQLFYFPLLFYLEYTYMDSSIGSYMLMLRKQITWQCIERLYACIFVFICMYVKISQVHGRTMYIAINSLFRPPAKQASLSNYFLPLD